MKHYVLVAALVALSFLAGMYVGRSLDAPTTPNPPDSSSMKQCVVDTLKLLNLDQPTTPASLRQSVEHCYSMIRSQGLVNDFSLRKAAYLQQYRANQILTWMVVLITLSGVGLAAVQLAASYQLARSSGAGLASRDELLLTRDKIVLKSSVAGLFILLISFAFFSVFVLYVYRIGAMETHAFNEPNVASDLPTGGLGPPPAAATPPNGR
jgi:hypothetical protein